MNYSEAIKFMQKKSKLGMRFGFERINRLLIEMSSPQKSLKIIHIAGTNGKGSIASSLATSLFSVGNNVGVFLTPWVSNYREQIQINGTSISEEDFTYYVDTYKNDYSTEFEFLTAIAFKYFQDKKVDYAIIECGLGGEKDATNVIESPLVSVITSLSYDHTTILGNSIEQIAEAKAGIIKKNGTLVLYPTTKRCHDVIAKKCKDMKAKLIDVEDKGNFKDTNLETVKQILLAIEREDCIPFVSAPDIPARQEMVAENVMLDGAHNIGGVEELVKYLPKNKKITAVIAMMSDKDAFSYMKVIAPHCEKIITTKTSDERCMGINDLTDIAKNFCKNVSKNDNPHKAVEKAIKDAEKDGSFVVICGSFYLAREVRNDLV